jgi:hypothetical protein
MTIDWRKCALKVIKMLLTEQWIYVKFVYKMGKIDKELEQQS